MRTKTATELARALRKGKADPVTVAEEVFDRIAASGDPAIFIETLKPRAMAEAKAQHDWARNAALMALIANAHRDPKKTRPFSPKDFNPVAVEARHRPLPKTRDLRILKQVFVHPTCQLEASL